MGSGGWWRPKSPSSPRWDSPRSRPGPLGRGVRGGGREASFRYSPALRRGGREAEGAPLLRAYRLILSRVRIPPSPPSRLRIRRLCGRSAIRRQRSRDSAASWERASANPKWRRLDGAPNGAIFLDSLCGPLRQFGLIWAMPSAERRQATCGPVEEVGIGLRLPAHWGHRPLGGIRNPATLRSTRHLTPWKPALTPQYTRIDTLP